MYLFSYSCHSTWISLRDEFSSESTFTWEKLVTVASLRDPIESCEVLYPVKERAFLSLLEIPCVTFKWTPNLSCLVGNTPRLRCEPPMTVIKVRGKSDIHREPQGSMFNRMSSSLRTLPPHTWYRPLMCITDLRSAIWDAVSGSGNSHHCMRVQLRSGDHYIGNSKREYYWIFIQFI